MSRWDFQEGVTDTISTVGETIQGVAQAADGVKDIMSGNFISGGIKAVGGIWKGVSAISMPGTRKLQERLKRVRE